MSPEFGSKRTPHLRSTVPNVQRHKAYFALRSGWGGEKEKERERALSGTVHNGGFIDRLLDNALGESDAMKFSEVGHVPLDVRNG